jgi:hypothetical protein
MNARGSGVVTLVLLVFCCSSSLACEIVTDGTNVVATGLPPGKVGLACRILSNERACQDVVVNSQGVVETIWHETGRDAVLWIGVPGEGCASTYQAKLLIFNQAVWTPITAIAGVVAGMLASWFSFRWSEAAREREQVSVWLSEYESRLRRVVDGVENDLLPRPVPRSRFTNSIQNQADAIADEIAKGGSTSLLNSAERRALAQRLLPFLKN